MASFNFLESSAILTDLSFLTVITTGLMNSSSEHFSSLMICLSSINFLSSFSTFSRRCSGTRLPLCWEGVYVDLKIDFAMWFFERPRRVHKCGYFWKTHFIIFFSVWRLDMKLMGLPVFFEALSVIPNFDSRSLPMILFVLFFTMRTLQLFAVHDPDCMSMMSTPSISMLLLLKHL